MESVETTVSYMGCDGQAKSVTFNPHAFYYYKQLDANIFSIGPWNVHGVDLGPLTVHWYGVMYLLGFIAAWALLSMRAKRSPGVWTADQLSDLIFYAVLGVVVGGRTGYMFFYQPLQWLSDDKLSFFKVWDGGMSFHGGLLGVVVAMFFFAKRYNKSLFQCLDFIAPVVPIGLGLGRIGNFINQELQGRVTDVAWAFIYQQPIPVLSGMPPIPPLPRHPSEIYEFLLEGVLLFLILWFFSKKPRPVMAVSALFSLLYGCFRFFAEFFRQPDPQFCSYLYSNSRLYFNWMTQGQMLSIPMILIGAGLLVYAYRRRPQ